MVDGGDIKEVLGGKIVTYISDMLLEEILEKLRRGSLYICSGS